MEYTGARENDSTAPRLGAQWSIPVADHLEETRAYTFRCVVSQGAQQAAADATVLVAAGTPPSVLIAPADPEPSYNADRPVRLLGRIISRQAGVALVGHWSAERQTLAGGWAVFDLARPSVLAPGITTSSENLVVSAGQLLPGAYRFALAARSAGSGAESLASSYLELVINGPPTGGTITATRFDASGAEVDPDEGGLLSGTAIEDVFVFSAAGWLDDNLPLLYRFKMNVGDTRATDKYLNDFTSDAQINAALPAGASSQNFRIAAIVEAQDDLGAAASASVFVRVRPYEVRTSRRQAAEDMLKSARDSGDTQRVNQIVQGLVDVLPIAQASTGNAVADAAADADAMAARGLLIDALIDIPVTGDSMERASQTLTAVTGNARQLSSSATDKSLNFASELATRYRGELQRADVENMMTTMSSLLTASSRQYTEETVAVAMGYEVTFTPPCLLFVVYGYSLMRYTLRRMNMTLRPAAR